MYNLQITGFKIHNKVVQNNFKTHNKVVQNNFKTHNKVVQNQKWGFTSAGLRLGHFSTG